MPDLNNHSEEIGQKELSFFDSRGGQISLLMHVAQNVLNRANSANSLEQ